MFEENRKKQDGKFQWALSWYQVRITQRSTQYVANGYSTALEQDRRHDICVVAVGMFESSESKTLTSNYCMVT